jgi:hypothetical protein
MNIVLENHDFVSVWKDTLTNQLLLKSNKEYQIGDSLTSFGNRGVFELPTYLTVQRSDKEHFLLEPIFLQYINHSCEPNVFFDLEKNELFALKHIDINEELTFFYPSTEWEMTQPFECNCNQLKCLKRIKGAKYIEQTVLSNYKLSSFIVRKVKEGVFTL